MLKQFLILIVALNLQTYIYIDDITNGIYVWTKINKTEKHSLFL